jgi:hypothetical protein
MLGKISCRSPILSAADLRSNTRFREAAAERQSAAAKSLL